MTKTDTTALGGGGGRLGSKAWVRRRLVGGQRARRRSSPPLRFWIHKMGGGRRSFSSSSLQKSSFCVPLAAARPSPAHEGRASQRHEVYLTGASGSHGGEKDLPHPGGRARLIFLHDRLTCVQKRHPHLVVSFTEEFESLGSLVHEDAVQVSRLHRADLDGLFAPAHDLV